MVILSRADTSRQFEFLYPRKQLPMCGPTKMDAAVQKECAPACRVPMQNHNSSRDVTLCLYLSSGIPSGQKKSGSQPRRIFSHN